MTPHKSEGKPFLRRIRDLLEGSQVWQVELIAAVLILVIGALDAVTGPEVALSLFYLIPIGMVAWVTGHRGGRVSVIAAGVTFLAADIISGAQYSNGFTQYWNAGIRTSVFLIVAEILAELRAALGRAHVMAYTDPLTDVANARQFNATATRELGRARRHPRPVSVAYIDCDNFKAVNDTLGHAAGDQLLREIAELLRSCIRMTDLVARVGGDEFVLLLPETPGDAARAVAFKIRNRLLELARNGNWPVTFSIGVVTFDEPPGDPDVLIAEADQVMYDVKRSGKNAVQHRLITPSRADVA